MKKNSYLLLIILLVAACNQDSKETTQEIVETKDMAVKPKQIADVPYMAVVDSISQKIKMLPSDLVKVEDLSPENVTESLGRKYPEIKIEWLKQKKDTAFIKIPIATYLTQGSGSMGAKVFMAEVVYSFTQIPGIQFVNFYFKEGDHASPGTYKREDFPFSK